MSLINEMLKELETRDGAASPKTPADTAYQDLRPVRYTRAGSSHLRVLLVSVLLVVALAAGGFYFFDARILEGRTAVATTVNAIPPPAPRAPAAEMEKPAEQAVSPPTAAAQESKSVAASPEPLAKQIKSASPVAPAAATGPVAVPKPAVKNEPARVAAPAPAAKPATASKPQEQTTLPGSSTTGKIAVEKRDRLLNPREQAEARYREAAQFIAQGRAEDARAVLYAAIAAYPEHHKARELAAALALQNGRFREARDLLTQGIKLAPDYIPFSQLLARIFMEQGAEAQAIATLENARAAAAGNADYFSFLAALYQRAGRHAEAVTTYRETISLQAQDARAWLGLGISLEATQDPVAAADAYQRALQSGGLLDPKLMQYAQQRLAALRKQ